MTGYWKYAHSLRDGGYHKKTIKKVQVELLDIQAAETEPSSWLNGRDAAGENIS